MKHFYVGIKAVIVQDGKVLMLKHAQKNFWDLPGGRIDENESIEETLQRELHEELPSATHVEIGSIMDAFRLPGSVDGKLGLTLLFYKVHALFPEGVAISPEHSAYEWVSFDEAVKRGSDAIQQTVRRLS